MGHRNRQIALVLAVMLLVGCTSVSSSLGHASRTAHPTHESQRSPLTIELEQAQEPVQEENESGDEDEEERDGVAPEVIVAVLIGGLTLFFAGSIVANLTYSP